MGVYPGQGQATLLTTNKQGIFWQNERIAAGSKSIAFQLERPRGSFYPFAAAFEVKFSGDPGSFEIDIQGAETDDDAHYVNLGTSAKVSSVNASYVGRYDMVAYYPRFVRLYIASLANDVYTTAIVTR